MDYEGQTGREGQGQNENEDKRTERGKAKHILTPLLKRRNADKRDKDRIRMRTKGRREGKANFILAPLFYKYGTREVLNSIGHF